jgi:hypothetical protein
MKLKWLLFALILSFVTCALIVVLQGNDGRHRARRMSVRENATMSVVMELPRTNSVKTAQSDGAGSK